MVCFRVEAAWKREVRLVMDIHGEICKWAHLVTALQRIARWSALVSFSDLPAPSTLNAY